MNARMLGFVGLITVLAVALAFVLVDRPDGPDVEDGESRLVPGLSDRVNDIAAIDIVDRHGDVAVRLRRDRDRWRVSEVHDYQADFTRIQELLRDLATARRFEARTASADRYPRLGVADPGPGEGSGVTLRFPETDLPGVIVGETDPADIGTYARLADADQSWLIDRDLDVAVDPMEWLQTAIMDIPAEDIAAVTIEHPDGETVELRPGDEEGSAWAVLGVPEGREAAEQWQVQQTANGLAGLDFVDVRPHESVPEDAVETVFETRDGLIFTARLFIEEDTHWVRFTVAADDSAGADEGDGATADEAATDSGDSNLQDESEAGDVAIDAVAVDGHLSPWQFAIEPSRHDNLTRRLEDLLKPLDDERD